jgi:Fe-Mn family superoxide dismutase
MDRPAEQVRPIRYRDQKTLPRTNLVHALADKGTGPFAAEGVENMLYKAKKFDLSELNGISNQTLEMHFKLYEGYVKETNVLQEKISAILKDGRVDQEEMPAYSELKRRLGFEYNGMVLHEYYFGNLKKDGGGDPKRGSSFVKGTEDNFGSYDIWKTDFVGIGKMRGVGWAICYQDPTNGRLSNHWVTLHESGNVAGYIPVLVMDVWEHAFILDYKPAERAKYIEAFFSNIDWHVVEERVQTSAAQPTRRARAS